MRHRLHREWGRLSEAVGRLHGQTVVVLTAAVLLVMVQYTLGSRQFFRAELAGLVPPAWRGLGAWGWWFGMQGITGFVVPVALLVFGYGRHPREIGLGRGDWRLALFLAACYLPLVIAGTWFLSAEASFQAVYPHYEPAARDWTVFLVYELLFLLYWVGWEYLWRGFVLFGTAPTFGIHAVFVQMVPFSLLHLDKPPAEMVLSVVGALVLGGLVWRCRSFWIAIPIHAAQMFVLDFWCTLRIRSGVQGVGWEALQQVFVGS